jgi:hypothetical protein
MYTRIEARCKPIKLVAPVRSPPKAAFYSTHCAAENNLSSRRYILQHATLAQTTFAFFIHPTRSKKSN